MRYSVTVLLLLFLYAGSVRAQLADSVFYEGTTGYDGPTTQQESFSGVDPAAVPPTRAYGSEKITVRKFDQKKWKEVVGSTDYNEGKQKRKLKKKEADPSTGAVEKSGEPGKRYLERDEKDMEDMEEEQAPDDSSSLVGPLMALILKILFYAIVIAIIAFLLYYIVRNVSFTSKSTKTKIGTPDFTTQVEDITALDVDHLLQRTLAAGDFRLAIRMCFLGLLKKLNEEGFIIWKKDKTNRDYLTELFSKPNYFEEVRRLTLAYEEIWYGDHTLPTESYQKLITEFRSIDQKLQSPKPR